MIKWCDTSVSRRSFANHVLSESSLIRPQIMIEWQRASVDTLNNSSPIRSRIMSEWVAPSARWLRRSPKIHKWATEFYSQPAHSQLSTTELRKERIISRRNSIQYVHSKDLYEWNFPRCNNTMNSADIPRQGLIFTQLGRLISCILYTYHIFILTSHGL